MKKVLLSLLALVIANLAFAEAPNNFYKISDDLVIADKQYQEVFAIGETIDLSADVQGNTHLIGEYIDIQNSIYGSLYAIGQHITIDSQVNDSVNAVGQNIVVDAPINGNARLVAERIDLQNNVGGELLIAAKTLKIAGHIHGDVSVAVENLTFGPEAQLHGNLTIYGKDNKFDIADSVISKNRIFYEEESNISSNFTKKKHRGKKRAFATIAKIIFISIIIFLLALNSKKIVANGLTASKQKFWKNIGYGIVALSTLVGSIIVSGLTIIGIPLAALLLLATIVIWSLSLLLGCYFITTNAVSKYLNKTPSTKAHLYYIALLSAVLVQIVAILPAISWFVALLITLYGLGATWTWRYRKDNG